MKLVEQLGSFVEQLDEWRVADTTTGFAGVAQLVEHDVANVVVVGSNPITRSLAAQRKCRNACVGDMFPSIGGRSVSTLLYTLARLCLTPKRTNSPKTK